MVGSIAIELKRPPIRKHRLQDMSLDHYVAQSVLSFSDVARDDVGKGPALSVLLQQNDVLGFLCKAIALRKTILISGGTSSGKTTLLNALLKEIPQHERVIAIEDTPEIRLSVANSLGLVAVAGDQGEAKVTSDDLMRASLRMRLERLIVRELRGRETVTFLRAINTGDPGSISTVHANSAQGALEQIAFMCMQAGLGLGRHETIDYARSMIDVIIQLDRQSGHRTISKVELIDSAD